ncbi:MAG: glycosyltransferase, partial [Pseudomonadota bacterium]
MSIAEPRMADEQRIAANSVDGQDILVAVPTLNEARHIEACIRSLMAGDTRLKNVKLIVADGRSTDGTQAIVQSLQGEFPNLHLMANEKKLQAAAINLV